VQAWLAELGHKPDDRTDASKGEAWAWHVVVPPDALDVIVVARAGGSDIVMEASASIGLESLGARRGADAAHRVRAAIQRRRTPRVETELHKNGKVWLRVHMGSEELRKELLAEQLKTLQREHQLFRKWVADALATGALPP